MSELWRKPLLLGLLSCLVLAALVGFGIHSGFALELVAARALPATNLKLAAASDTDTDASRETYLWVASRTSDSLKLRGSVPSEDDRRTILGMVKAHFPDLQVQDRLEVVAGSPPKEQWLGAMSFSLKQLSHLKQGSARLLNVGLKLNGEALSANDYAEIKTALSGPLPTGLSIISESIRPPAVDPFVFAATLDENALSLSGSVPSEDARKHVRELSRQLFTRPGLEDKLQLGSGAPKGWDNAVDTALRALSQLESGKVSLSGLALTIEGIARDERTATKVSYRLKRDMPEPFSTSESIRWKTAVPNTDTIEQIVPRINELARSGSQLTKFQLPLLEQQ